MRNHPTAAAVLLALTVCSSTSAEAPPLRTIQVDDGHTARMAVEEVGDGRLLVVLNGAFRPAIEPVVAARAGWRRVYVDPPGIGASDSPDWIADADDYLEAVLAAVDQVTSGELFAVAGFSYYGYLARAVACRRPERVRGLLAACPVVVPERSARDVPEPTFVERDDALAASLDEDGRALLEMLVVQTRPAFDRLLASLRPDGGMDEAFFGRLRENGYGLSIEPEAMGPNLAVPVLVVLGRQDAVVGYRDGLRLVDRYPAGTFAVVHGAGHALPYDQPDLWRGLLDDWLARVERELPPPPAS